MDIQKTAVLQAVIAAACYGISAPFSKILLAEIPPTLMAALLYLGAGIGMSFLSAFQNKRGTAKKEAKVTRKDFPYVVAMIVLDIVAPIFLMVGLTMTTAANASLLNNFEIVATSLIALIFFKEAIGRRTWIAIILITFSSILLSVEDVSGFSFSIGSIFVLLACICWGLENNCTRMLSLKNPVHIVVLKGFGSGLGALGIAFILGESSAAVPYVIAALVLGFFAYGLSIFFYIRAQRELGAARTSAYYAVAPFIGVGLSFLIFGQDFTPMFFIALVIMIAGSYYAAVEKHKHLHTHCRAEHEHRHSHSDDHHTHTHSDFAKGEHSHPHVHEETVHSHTHTPDMHHNHSH